MATWLRRLRKRSSPRCIEEEFGPKPAGVRVSPTPVRWVIANRGDAMDPVIRARLVARHVAAKHGGKDGLYELLAAIPLFEIIKFRLFRVAQGGAEFLSLYVLYSSRTLRRLPPHGAEGSSTRKVKFIDTSRAHLNAPIVENGHQFVDHPRECAKEGICGHLRFRLYGMRPASQGWEEE